MSGPGIPFYLAVAGVLFSIGAMGVLLRRSVLIVLLSLELMLNASTSRSSLLAALRRRWTARSSRSR